MKEVGLELWWYVLRRISLYETVLVAGSILLAQHDTKLFIGIAQSEMYFSECSVS